MTEKRHKTAYVRTKPPGTRPDGFGLESTDPNDCTNEQPDGAGPQGDAKESGRPASRSDGFGAPGGPGAESEPAPQHPCGSQDDPALQDGLTPQGGPEPEDGAEADGDELYEHFAFTVDAGQAPLRIDRWLTDRLRNCSRSRLQAAADGGNILVGGRAVKPSYKVRPSDRIRIVLPYPPRDTQIEAENIPLDITYEDEEVLVVNKPAGMVVHPGHGNWNGTLVNALLWHLSEDPQPAPEGGRAGLVHRIDKDTSGLLVVAKTERANASLARQFFDHTVRRRYTALVWGSLASDEGTIEGNIGRSPRDRKSMAVFPDGSAGKPAVTHYRVLRRYGYATLVECRLETGRTHQIRVHMAYIGHPLFGDARYGGDRILRGTTSGSYRRFAENCLASLGRQALHARSLGFVHPATGREMVFERPLPDDFAAVLEKWENYTAPRGACDTRL